MFTYTNLGGMRDNKSVLSDVIHMEHLIAGLSPVELFAAKINALISRAATRDL